MKKHIRFSFEIEGDLHPGIIKKLLPFVVLLVCLIIFMAITAHGQALPDAPTPQLSSFMRAPLPHVAPAAHSNRPLLAAFAIDGTVRALDAWSTELAKPDDNNDLFLPRCIVQHGETMLVFEGGVVGAEIVASRWLDKHHHRRLAIALPLIDAAATAPWVGRNFLLNARDPSPWGRGW